MQVNVKEFVKELGFTLRFVGKQSTIPILQNVHLSASVDRLTVCGTDLEIAGVTSITGQPDGAEIPWATTAPAHMLLKYLKQVKDTTVRVLPTITKSEPYKVKKPVLDEKGAKIWDATTKEFKETEVEKIDETHRLILTHGKDSEASFDGMGTASFPEIPIPDKIYGELRGLKLAHQRSSIAVSAEESRFTLNGSLLELNPDGQSVIVSTDGHRLSYLPIDATALHPCKTIIRKNALYEASRMNGDSCLFGMNENFHLFLGPQRSIISRKLTGTFPDYTRVMPKEFWRSITLKSAELAEVIQRVSVCADERSQAITFSVEGGKLVVEAKQYDKSAKGAVPIFCSDDMPWKCGFNFGYCLDFLKLAPETVTLKVPAPEENTGNVKGASEFVTEDQWKYLIMPLRI